MPPSSHGVHVRSDFKATAFFIGALEIGRRGLANVTFELPGNLGTWAIRVAGVGLTDTGHKAYGTTESALVARKQLNLQPSMPRITRPGDRFSGGCTVTALKASAVKVEVRLAGSPWISVVGPATRTVSVGADTPAEVLFNFTSGGVGEANVTFVATAIDDDTAAAAVADQASLTAVDDAFQLSLPLLGQQDAVFVSTSFYILAQNSSGKWAEGIQLPPAVKGSGRLNLTAGVGHLPGVARDMGTILASVVRQLEQQQWAWVTDLIASLAPPLAYNTYGRPYHRELARLNASLLDMVVNYTAGDNGLQTVPLSKCTYPPFPGVYPNWIALYVVKQEMQRQFFFPELGPVLLLPETARAIASWETALVAALRSDYESMVASGSLFGWDWDQVALLRFALGANWAPCGSCGVPPAFVRLISLDGLLAHLKTDCSTDSQAMVALALLRESNATTAAQREMVVAMATVWYNDFRVQGETAYISDGGGSPSALSLSTNAIVLRVFQNIDAYRADPLVEKLANWVAGPALQSGFYSDYSPIDLAFAGLALAVYDEMHNASRPDLAVTARTEPAQEMILKASFKSAATPPASASVPFSSANTITSLDFRATGSGEAAFDLGIEFVPSVVFSEPVFFGLLVEKTWSVLLPNGSTVGVDSTMVLRPGDIVQIDIQVTAEDDQLGGIVVKDLLSTALQAMDPDLPQPTLHASAPVASDATGDATAEDGDEQQPPPQPPPTGGGFDPYAWYPNSPWMWGFQSVAVYKDRVVCFTPLAYAGSISCTYRAQVVTSGNHFSIPPAHAYATTAPGTFGLSASGNVSVAARQTPPW